MLNKFLLIVKTISSLGILVCVGLLINIQNFISYETAPLFERVFGKTPKSSLFIVMEHNPILGYLLVVLSVILALSTSVSFYINCREDKDI